MMRSHMLLLSPAVLYPTVSASNRAAAAVVACAADASKMIAASAATCSISTSSSATTPTATGSAKITAAAKTVAQACTSAIAACIGAFAGLLAQCQRAWRRLFGRATPLEAGNATALVTTTATAVPKNPNLHDMETKITAMTMDTDAIAASASRLLALAVAKTPLPTANAMVLAASAASAASTTLVVPGWESVSISALASVDDATTTVTNASKRSVMAGRLVLPERTALVAMELPVDVAQCVVDDCHYVRELRKALTTRHAARGRVPGDTVLKMVLCLAARLGDEPILLAYRFAIVDVVLRALACFDGSVVAAYADLSADWLVCYGLYSAMYHGRMLMLDVDGLAHSHAQCHELTYEWYVRASD